MSDWISVEDELPEPRRNVIIWCLLGKSCAEHESYFGWWTGSKWDCVNHYLFDVTHWQPIPDGPAPAPTAEEQAADDRTERILEARIELGEV